MHSTQDTFTFIKEREEVREYNNFSLSFDTGSLFTNIPLNKTIELALDYTLSNNADINNSRKELKIFFGLSHLKHIFILLDIFMNKLTGCRKIIITFILRKICWWCFLNIQNIRRCKFFDILNIRNKNIKLTIKKEQG